MKVLSLFSGIGGIDLGLEWAGMTTIGQVEIDGFCNTILEKHWPGLPRWGDIRALTVDDILSTIGRPDVIAGGSPCQGFSVAGKGLGIEDDRSGLWVEMHRLIDGIKPAWVLVENVPALRTRGADRFLSDLEGSGYTCWPVVVGAWAVGASHKRERVWIVAHHNSELLREQSRRGEWANREETIELREPCETLANTNSQRHEGERRARQTRRPVTTHPALQGQPQFDWEEPRAIESSLGASINGIPYRLALRAIGNSVVPQIPYVIGKWMMRQTVN